MASLNFGSHISELEVLCRRLGEPLSGRMSLANCDPGRMVVEISPFDQIVLKSTFRLVIYNGLDTMNFISRVV